MYVIIGLISVLCVIGFFIWANRPTRSMTHDEVAKIISDFVDGTGGERDWHDFICGGRINDPRLENIRLRCAGLADEFPPASGAGYCSVAGVDAMREMVSRLEASYRDQG